MTKRLPLIVFGLLIVLMAAVEMTRPRPLDQRLRLERVGTNPFDGRILFEMLPVWTGDAVSAVDEPPFLALSGDERPATYLFLTDEFTNDQAETDRLLRFVETGGTLFLAVQELYSPLADSLGSRDSPGSQRLWFTWRVSEGGSGDSALVLSAPGVSGTYRFPFTPGTRSLSALDSSRTRVLGTFSDGAPSLVQIRWGEGQVILSSTPQAFTNAALVEEGSDAPAYVGAVLSYLPDGDIWWDGYYKPFNKSARSSLRVAWRTPGLRWALVLTALGAVLYTVFRGRRWQRAIPVVKRRPNVQREFARTVGRLHATRGTPAQLLDRLEHQLLDRFRTQLHLAAPESSAEDFRLAAGRAGVPEDEGEELFETFRRLRATAKPSATDLIALERQSSRFFRNVLPSAAADGRREAREGPRS